MRRLSDATRATLSDRKQAKPERPDKPISELTDRELEEELLRRRRARARHRSGEDEEPAARQRSSPSRGTRAGRRAPASPKHKQLRQYYANLELEPGASLGEVRRAYRELMRKYHPDKHADDPERHRAATELAQSLTQAYRALAEHLRDREE